MFVQCNKVGDFLIAFVIFYCKPLLLFCEYSIRDEEKMRSFLDSASLKPYSLSKVFHLVKKNYFYGLYNKHHCKTNIILAQNLKLF